MDDDFRLSAYNYHLPPEQIAQHPAARRDRSRLLVLDTTTGVRRHLRFDEIASLLRQGDLLVVNNTKVFPARLLGKKETGGRVEMLLLHYPETVTEGSDAPNWYEAKALTLVKSSKRPKPGSLLLFGDTMQATVQRLLEDGKVKVILRFRTGKNGSLDDLLARHGQIPLPPYISRPKGSTGKDMHRYQTRYATTTGSVAAPTAGLHFSDELLARIDRLGIGQAGVTLHVGYGTFAPVRTEDIRQHRIHREFVQVSRTTAETINAAKRAGGRIWAVGTTTVRTLEFAADRQGLVQPVQGLCDMFIYPGYRFRVIDNLITNFHLPQSSLLFLVAALAGRRQILDCYREAVEKKYRFFSYGDAMALITRP